jgi:hypothetical protein
VEASKVKKATKRELIVVATLISRMIGTPVFSDRTEFSVTTTGKSRASLLHRERAFHSFRKRKELPAIGKAVGGYMENAHKQRALAESQRAGRQL